MNFMFFQGMAGTLVYSHYLRCVYAICTYGTVQAQVYTRVRVKRRALAWRGVRVFRVLDKAFTREAHTCCNLSPFACIAASLY